MMNARILWSAAVDPDVLAGSTVPHSGAAVDLAASGTRWLSVTSGEVTHAVVHLGPLSFRLDLDACSSLDRPLRMIFHVPDDAMFERKLAVARAFRAAHAGKVLVRTPGDLRRLERYATALRVADALADGASLREIWNAVGQRPCDSDTWPGRGEHAKSRTRRLVAIARNLVAHAPSSVLGGAPPTS